MATYMLEEFYNLTFQASSNNHPCIRIAEDKDDGGTQVKNCPPVLNFLSFFRWNMKEPWTMTFRFQYLRVTICSFWSLGVVPNQHNTEIKCLQWFYFLNYFFPTSGDQVSYKMESSQLQEHFHQVTLFRWQKLQMLLIGFIWYACSCK